MLQRSSSCYCYCTLISTWGQSCQVTGFEFWYSLDWFKKWPYLTFLLFGHSIGSTAGPNPTKSVLSSVRHAAH